VFSNVWFLNVQSWTWYEISVNNSIYAAPQLWSHPAVMIDRTAVVFANPVTSTVNSAAASLMTGVPRALMKLYSLDCSELETSQKCSWRPVLSNNKSIPASSLHSVNVCEDMILIFGGLSDEQTVQTANNTPVFVTPFWTHWITVIEQCLYGSRVDLVSDTARQRFSSCTAWNDSKL
jgi:hypothetical protein